MKTSRLTTANWVRISFQKLRLMGDLEVTAGSQRKIAMRFLKNLLPVSGG